MPSNNPLGPRQWARLMDECRRGTPDEDFESLLLLAPNPIPARAGTLAVQHACLRAKPKALAHALALGAKPEALLLATMAQAVDGSVDPKAWADCVKLLRDQCGVNLNQRAMWGYSALHHALRESSFSAPWAAVALLDLGASPTLQTRDKETPLELALAYGNEPAARRLFDLGLDVAPPSSALRLAAVSMNPDVVSLVLDRGADPHQRVGDPSDDAAPESTLSMVDFALLEAQEQADRLAAFGLQDNPVRIVGMLRAAMEARQLSQSTPSGAAKPRSRSL